MQPGNRPAYRHQRVEAVKIQAAQLAADAVVFLLAERLVQAVQNLRLYDLGRRVGQIEPHVAVLDARFVGAHVVAAEGAAAVAEAEFPVVPVAGEGAGAVHLAFDQGVALVRTAVVHRVHRPGDAEQGHLLRRVLKDDRTALQFGARDRFDPRHRYLQKAAGLVLQL